MGRALSITAFVFSLLFFIPGAFLVGLVLGIVAINKSKNKKDSLRGLAIAAVVISSIFLILAIIFAFFIYSERYAFNKMEQKITIENKGLTQEEYHDVVKFLEFRLEQKGFTDFKAGTRGGNYVIAFNDYNKTQILNLLSSNLLEARIGNTIVFNSMEDVINVCRRDANCAGITSCEEEGDIWTCKYSFLISLDETTSQRIAEATSRLSVVNENENNYLNESLIFVLDGEEIDSLKLDSRIRGEALQNMSIGGDVNGTTKEKAISNAMDEMSNYQTLFSFSKFANKLSLS